MAVKAKVSVVLDYYPSTQFAGLHYALKKGLYASKGLEVELLPPAGAGGEEPELVAKLQQKFNDSDGGAKGQVPHVAVGSVEQNVLIPAIARNIKVKAFATIFQSSPLSVAAKPGTPLNSVADLKGLKVGMHIDSVELMHTLLGNAAIPATTDQIKEVQRATKIQDLIDGKVDAIQIYDCMEGIELESLLGGKPSILKLEDGAKSIGGGFALPLGYSQVLFSSASALAEPAVRNALVDFLSATEEGWRLCRTEQAEAAEAVLEARKAAGLPASEVMDNQEFQICSMEQCLALVVGAKEAKLLTIDPTVWQAASLAMANTGYSSSAIPLLTSLDTQLWSSSAPQPLSTFEDLELAKDGVKVANLTIAEAAARSAALKMRVKRAPKLAIVTSEFGAADANPMPFAPTRHALFGSQGPSWFYKEAVCEQAGVELERVRLPMSATFAQAHSAIMALNRRKDIDAILVEKPMPEGIDPSILGGLITPEKDVDGQTALPLSSQTETLSQDSIFQPSLLTGASPADAAGAEGSALPPAPQWLQPGVACPPVFVAGVMKMLHTSGLINRLSGSHCLIIGRSRQLGLPLAMELVRCNASVTICNSETPKARLQELCKSAQVIFPAAGVPGILTKDMVSSGAAIINLGTTFDANASALLADTDPEVASVAQVVTPTPHGCGPQCVAGLVLNSVKLAETRARVADAETRHKSRELAEDPALVAVGPETLSCEVPSWTTAECSRTGSQFIKKTFELPDFKGAVDFVCDLRVLAERANHHPTIAINDNRVCEQEGGCDVRVELNTYASKSVTKADLLLAQQVDALSAAFGIPWH